MRALPGRDARLAPAHRLEGLLRIHWSAEILDEWERAVLRTRPDLAASLRTQRRLMRRAVTDAEVEVDAGSIRRVPPLADPGDTHVVAAALAAGATLIVTMNLKDFPSRLLRPLGLEAVSPDTLLAPLTGVHRETFDQVLDAMLSARRRPPLTMLQLLDAIEASGLTDTAKELRRPR